MNRVILHYGTKLFLPISVRDVIATVKSVKYVCEGVRTLLKGKIEVPVLDGTAIGVSVIPWRLQHGKLRHVPVRYRRDPGGMDSQEVRGGSGTKHVAQHQQGMLIREGKEELTELTAVNSGDRVVVHMGNVIPFDGDVVAGEAMVNQASLTGESNPIRKIEGGYAYAGHGCRGR